MQPYAMRRATVDDLPAIMTLLEGRVEWLRTVKRSDQWADVADWQPVLKYLIRRGLTWVASEAGGDRALLGTVTLSTDPDLDFWTDHECGGRACYLSKLATAAENSGRGLGRFILDWSVVQAEGAGAQVVRLDAWRTSEGLLQYYKDQGWEHVGTVEKAGRRSGALFQYVVPASTKELPQAELADLLARDAHDLEDHERTRLVTRLATAARRRVRATTRPSPRSGPAARA